MTNESTVDVDGDGASTICGEDCDDNDPANFPGNREVCDGQDNDCDSATNEVVDDDGDGFAECGGLDCDDAEPAVFPGAVEACNDVDDDCDGALSGDELDDDGDGQTECAGDCDDADDAAFVGNPELCDGLDNDCDDDIDQGTACTYCTRYETATSLYQLCSDLAHPWDVARTSCQDANYDLVVFDSPSEIADVTAQILSVIGPGLHVWIGAHSPSPAAPFEWIDGDPLPLEDPNWALGEPTGVQEDCVAISDDEGGAWVTLACGATHSFACELTLP